MGRYRDAGGRGMEASAGGRVKGHGRSEGALGVEEGLAGVWREFVGWS